MVLVDWHKLNKLDLLFRHDCHVFLYSPRGPPTWNVIRPFPLLLCAGKRGFGKLTIQGESQMTRSIGCNIVVAVGGFFVFAPSAAADSEQVCCCTPTPHCETVASCYLPEICAGFLWCRPAAPGCLLQCRFDCYGWLAPEEPREPNSVFDPDEESQAAPSDNDPCVHRVPTHSTAIQVGRAVLIVASFLVP